MENFNWRYFERHHELDSTWTTKSIDKVTKEIVNMICGAREVHLKKLS